MPPPRARGENKTDCFPFHNLSPARDSSASCQHPQLFFFFFSAPEAQSWAAGARGERAKNEERTPRRYNFRPLRVGQQGKFYLKKKQENVSCDHDYPTPPLFFFPIRLGKMNGTFFFFSYLSLVSQGTFPDDIYKHYPSTVAVASGFVGRARKPNVRRCRN